MFKTKYDHWIVCNYASKPINPCDYTSLDVSHTYIVKPNWFYKRHIEFGYLTVSQLINIYRYNKHVRYEVFQEITRRAPNMKHDISFLKIVLATSSYAFKYMSAEARDNEELAKMVMHNAEAFSKVSLRLRNDKKFMKYAIRYNSLLFEYASDKLQNNTKIVTLALRLNSCLYKFAPEKYRQDHDFVLKLCEKYFDNPYFDTNESICSTLLDDLTFMYKLSKLALKKFDFIEDTFRLVLGDDLFSRVINHPFYKDDNSDLMYAWSLMTSSPVCILKMQTIIEMYESEQIAKLSRKLSYYDIKIDFK